MTNIITSNKEDDKDRVVITGIGVVSPIGVGRVEFWNNLQKGASGIGNVTLFDTSTTKSKMAAEVVNFKPEAILNVKGLRNLDRTTLFALAAAKLAMEDSSFQVTESNQYRVGVVLGSTMGSIRSINEFDKEGIKNGPKAVNPALFPNTVMNSPASQISIKFGIKGFNTTISTGFTSSLEALEYARKFIQLGRADVVLAGGVEELCEQTYKGCYKVGFLSGSKKRNDELCAPFDKRRNGVVLGEGACLFVLESLSSASKRNAPIYGELKPAASSYDKHSFYKYNPRADGAKLVLNRALKNASLLGEMIDYVASGANSSLGGDVAEARALGSLSRKKTKIVASASKSMIGESFSASAAFQVASALMALNNGFIPPTINFKEADDRCNQIDCVANEARAMKVRNALILNISPMGQNCAVVLSKDSL